MTIDSIKANKVYLIIQALIASCINFFITFYCGLPYRICNKYHIALHTNSILNVIFSGQLMQIY